MHCGKYVFKFRVLFNQCGQHRHCRSVRRFLKVAVQTECLPCVCVFVFVRFVCFASIQSQPKVFSAGLDIMEMYGKSPEHCGEFWKAVQEMWLKLYSSNMVTIAAINVRIKRNPHLHLHSVPVSHRDTRAEQCRSTTPVGT